MRYSAPFSAINRVLQNAFHGRDTGTRLVAIATIAITVLLFIAILLALFTFLIQWLWSWLVPDLFPSAVRDGALAGAISWWTAFKILIALLLIGSLFGGHKTNVIQKSSNPPAQAVIASAPAEPEAAPAVSNPRVFPTLIDPLTDRELEVLQLVGKGLTNQQIAVQLNLSESTVVYHIGHIFGKLRVSSRVEAAVWAKEHGII